jgi:hypothetical protein
MTEIKFPVENPVQGYGLEFKFSPSREVKASTSSCQIKLSCSLPHLKNLRLWKLSLAL